MSAGQQSDSREQRAAEPLILQRVAEHLGRPLKPQTVKLASGAKVQVDGVAEDMSAFVEIFARHGALKGGQQKKVSHDALKLITLGRAYPRAQLVIAFADQGAARYATQGTWVSEALAAWNVEVVVVEIDSMVSDGIRTAQARQQMVNPAAPPPDDADPE